MYDLAIDFFRAFRKREAAHVLVDEKQQTNRGEFVLSLQRVDEHLPQVAKVTEGFA